jgi:hypothetical protein
LQKHERLHGLSVQAFLAVRGEIANEAASSGLTPERIMLRTIGAIVAGYAVMAASRG